MIALMVYLLVRNTPEDMGLQPYGIGEVNTPEKKRKVSSWNGFTMTALRKNPVFYLMLLCTFLSCGCVLATQYNLVPYLQDCGMSATRTSRIYGTMMLLLGVSKFGLGKAVLISDFL